MTMKETDKHGHQFLDGMPIHKADDIYGAPFQVKGGFWFVGCHCLLCGCRMSKPTRKDALEVPSDPSGNENQPVAPGSPKSASGLISYNKGSAA